MLAPDWLRAQVSPEWYSTKRDVQWMDYDVHLTETYDDGQPHLITQVMTTPATTPDGVMGPTIHQDLAQRDLLPSSHLLDSGYVDAELLVTAQIEHQLDTKIWAAALNTSRFFLFDVAADPMNPRLIRTIDDVPQLTGLSCPHTPYAIPGRMLISMASGPDGSGPGGLAEFTNEGPFVASPTRPPTTRTRPS